MLARKLLERLIADRGETYFSVSRMLGKNNAYIQQYIKRGSPKSLSADDQDRLARHFNMPPNFLRVPHEHLAGESEIKSGQLKFSAASHLRQAIALCEDLRANGPLCHIQYALDLLERRTCDEPKNTSHYSAVSKARHLIRRRDKVVNAL